ncbi:MAG: prolyl oligopeptidase family serine peptidase [Vicinamibacteria bacterium]
MSRPGVVLASLLAFGLLADRAFAQPLTIEAIMQAPYVLELSTAPSRGALAFVIKEQGRRNIYIAEPPSYTPKKLTAFDKDDGIEITDLTWSKDAQTLLFVRGGDTNRRSERPNPTSNPEGVKQQVHLINLQTGDIRAVGEGHAPVISTKGDQIFYVTAGGELFAAPFAGGDGKSIVKTRGGIAEVTLSPDGERLAFANPRGDHAFIGIYDFETQAVTHLDPSVDTDSNPVFSPDGSRIAFLRQAADSLALPFAPVREGEPWSIHTFDFRSGVAKEVFRADRGKGSAFSGLASPKQILWSEDDRLSFVWEKTGWKNLYSIPSTGGTPLNLIPGEHEIEMAVLTNDGRDLLAVTNAGDINRRRIIRVNPSGKPAPITLTSAGQIEWAAQSTSDGGTAFVRSDAQMPGRVFVRTAAGEKNVSGSLIPATFPGVLLVTPTAVSFQAKDGMTISGQLFLPPGLKPLEKRAALLFTHGGSRRQMLLGWHYMEYYHGSYAMNQYLASLGYVVLSINYRSGIGYGLDFREALSYGATGASEFNDVLGAGAYLRSRADVDPARVGLWGGSYGGYLTALGLSRASDIFKAGVDFHGVHNWNEVVGNFSATYDPRKREAFAKIAFQSSPMSTLDTWRSPVLVIHGDDDRNVPFSETVTLVQELRKRNVEVEQLIFPDEVHDLLRHESWVKAFERSAAYLNQKLK